jgi:hypothetical protein
VCYAKLEKGNLHFEGVDYSEPRSNQYTQESFGEICPFGGEIYFMDEDISCSLHPRDNNSSEDDDDHYESTPYL